VRKELALIKKCDAIVMWLVAFVLVAGPGLGAIALVAWGLGL
jgi:hypothetical protein